MSAVTVRVPAKINLYLGVGPARPDGYHDLATVFQAVSVYDEVTVRRADAMSVQVIGPWAPEVPIDQTNLAWRAAEAVARAAAVEQAFAITIDKSIPVAGGLAGGSADAAAALVATNEVLGSSLSWDDLERLAAGLGSDVPFLLHGGSAVGTGRGIELTPVLTRGSFHWVLATFASGLSTPDMYADLDRRRGPGFTEPPEVPESALRALAQGDPHLLADQLANDLQPSAVAARAALADVLTAGRDLGALGGIVSGSGPTCMFLVGSESQALDVAAGLRASGLVNSALSVHGPVHGARVVTG